MTRFDAATPEDRRALIADAVAAHRDRESPYVTIEADGPPGGDDDDEPDDASDAPAWVQFRAPDGLLNLDCTDAELDRLGTLLDRYPECTIEARESPDDAEGTNVKIRTYTDDDRLAGLVDDLFVDVYGYDRSVRLWAATV